MVRAPENTAVWSLVSMNGFFMSSPEVEHKRLLLVE